MQYRIVIDRKKIIGKRPNLAEQNSITDEIVSAFSVPPENAPLPPLSPLPATAPHAPTPPRNPQGGTIAASVLLFLPFLYPIVFFVHGAFTGHPVPVMLYPMLVLAARLLANIGSLILYLSARAANYLRKPAGCTALAALILPIVGMVLFGGPLLRLDPTGVSSTRGWLIIASMVLTLLSMFALCVLCALLLIRVFRKKSRLDAA